MLKYHSTPKPVRIRIESGGEEHFSLDSLLKCFNPADLLGKRNELLRWLDFQGNEGKLISEELRTIEDSHQNDIEVNRAFYNDGIKLQSGEEEHDSLLNRFNPKILVGMKDELLKKIENNVKIK